MKIRDLMKKKSEYKGKEIEAGLAGIKCPCMPCFNVHDCGYRNSAGKWVEQFDCATRFTYGCPDRLPDALHIIKWMPIEKCKEGKVVKCLRCGYKFKMGIKYGVNNWKMEDKNEQTKKEKKG